MSFSGGVFQKLVSLRCELEAHVMCKFVIIMMDESWVSTVQHVGIV